jgi:2-methylisocitrate lyase-like PEP mutase family enzyme
VALAGGLVGLKIGMVVNTEVGMTQAEKGTPLRLFNAWDAGTAKVIQSAGAKAIATSSWSVAEAQGYRDGEHITDDALIKKISDNVSLPVNVMVMDGLSPAKRLAELGVARISYGPIPYIKAMNALKEEARASEA